MIGLPLTGEEFREAASARIRALEGQAGELEASAAAIKAGVAPARRMGALLLLEEALAACGEREFELRLACGSVVSASASAVLAELVGTWSQPSALAVAFAPLGVEAVRSAMELFEHAAFEFVGALSPAERCEVFGRKRQVTARDAARIASQWGLRELAATVERMSLGVVCPACAGAPRIAGAL